MANFRELGYKSYFHMLPISKTTNNKTAEGVLRAEYPHRKGATRRFN